MLADFIAEAWAFPKFKRPWRWRARVTKGVLGTEQVVVVKPQTYMNRSGSALEPLLRDSAFDPTRDLLAVVDEVALPLGTFRLRRGGSSGGHNGLKSIAGRLGSEDYCRLRIGVGPRPETEDATDYVLGEFEPPERETISALLPTLASAVECWIHEGIDAAMNRFNRRGNQSE